MRVVFLGTPEWAVPSLDAILSAGHDVPLVVTQPDRPSGRTKTPRFPPVKSFALAHGLRVIQPETVRTDPFLAELAAVGPEALAVVAYGRILTRPVLDTAPRGAINLHFSLLPALRGAAPVQWALARGDLETGVTTFRIDEGLDTGELLLQRGVPIGPGEHAPALLARLAATGAELLVETLLGLAAGSIASRPQDHARATAAPRLTREHGLWDPAWNARELEGRVRGFDPWPGVWASCGEKRIRIVDALAVAGAIASAAAGTILTVRGDAFGLACAGGSVAEVLSVQTEGGRAMSARGAVNGRLLGPGDRFERPRPAA